MTRKLIMMLATVAAAFGAWAETETVGGYTWTYRINGDTADIYNGSSAVISAAVSPSPTGAVTIPSSLGGQSVVKSRFCCIKARSVASARIRPDIGGRGNMKLQTRNSREAFVAAHNYVAPRHEMDLLDEQRGNE